MCNITSDRTINLQLAVRSCGCDGNSYKYMNTCINCDGAQKFKKGNRNYKCKGCNGTGLQRLENPILLGPCNTCKGSQQVQMNMYDNATDKDKLWIFDNLFNFETSYVGQYSGFNESYLGHGIYCGVTDYGRYLSMTPKQFKAEVKENFITRFNQYIGITKNGKLPDEVLIRKSKSGWTAYPVYKQ